MRTGLYKAWGCERELYQTREKSRTKFDEGVDVKNEVHVKYSIM
jgi:hypothetical protein